MSESLRRQIEETQLKVDALRSSIGMGGLKMLALIHVQETREEIKKHVGDKFDDDIINMVMLAEYSGAIDIRQ